MKDLKIYVAIASVLLIVYLVAQYNRPKDVNWSQTLGDGDKIPFGTYILYHRLNDIFPGAKVSTFRQPIFNVINSDSVKTGSYLIVCNSLNVNDYDYDKLTSFIKKGNDVFIAANYFGPYLQKHLKFDVTSDYKADWFNFKYLNKNLDTNKLYTLDKELNNVYFEVIDSASTIALGSNTQQKLNFIKINFGKGALYLNTNPLMFTNYSLLQDQGAAYASIALSHLKNRKNIIWDEYYTLGLDDEETPFRVFLRSPALKWALYISLFGLVVFMVYEMKRRQRIIPVMEPLSNSTIDFVSVVGQVYYEQRNNANIAQKKVTYFFEHIRAKYNLKITALDAEFIEKLANKSGADATLLRELVDQIIVVRSGYSIKDKELIALNLNIEKFYTQSA